MIYHVECAQSKECAPYKHHFDECVERVTRNGEDPNFKGPHEDCVEECEYSLQQLEPGEMWMERKIGIFTDAGIAASVFHLTHCATECAAPKLWKQLK